MEKTFLYIKESLMGLKYLGKTTQNPYTYNGSGIRWKRHIRKYNFTKDDIKTTILFETSDEGELKKMGLYYSELYDIVKNYEWANLKNEIGDGGSGPMKDDIKAKIKKTMKGRKPIFSEDIIKKRNESMKGRKMPPCKEETKKILSEKFKGRVRGVKTKDTYIKSVLTRKKNGYHITDETKEKIRKTLMGHKVNESTIEKLRLNNPKSKKVMVDGIYYGSIREAERELKLSRHLIKKYHNYKII